MKLIGLVGGMSWYSTVTYYKLINKYISNKLGKEHSARIILNSMDFQEIKSLQTKGEWDSAVKLIIQEMKKLDAIGCELIGI